MTLNGQLTQLTGNCPRRYIAWVNIFANFVDLLPSVKKLFTLFSDVNEASYKTILICTQPDNTIAGNFPNRESSKIMAEQFFFGR